MQKLPLAQSSARSEVAEESRVEIVDSAPSLPALTVRTGRNPKTGASVSVPPKRLPYFKVGKNFAAS